MSTRAMDRDLPPCWRVRVGPADRTPAKAQGAIEDGRHVLYLADGVGFGLGEHPSTQLCLHAIGYLARTGVALKTVLDVGAGSGILALAAARLGAKVEAVEIDEPSLVHARINLALNGLEDRIELRTTCAEPPRPFDLVVANILRPVLVELAEIIALRVADRGRLVLAGLLATDVPATLARYRPLLPAHRSEVYERGEWRAIIFAPT